LAADGVVYQGFAGIFCQQSPILLGNAAGKQIVIITWQRHEAQNLTSLGIHDDGHAAFDATGLAIVGLGFLHALAQGVLCELL